MKQIVFFITKAPSITCFFIEYLLEHFPEYDNHFIVVDRKGILDLPDLPNIHLLPSYADLFFKQEINSLILNCDKIIVSGIFTMQYFLPFFPSRVLSKCYLQFWGGDFYTFHKRSVKNAINKFFVQRCLKQCASVIALTDGDELELKKMFPYSKPTFHVPVPGDSSQRNIRMKYRGVSSGRKIVVGNSATRENNHLEAFELLKQVGGSGIEIWVPLSYGDQKYAATVIASGEKLFGEKFHPITKYMSYEEYIEFLSSCSVGLFNNNRQQGLGNITALFELGKKVYLRRDTSMWHEYEKYQFEFRDIMDLKKQSMDELFRWDEQQSDNNYLAAQRRESSWLEEWRVILSSNLLGRNMEEGVLKHEH